MKKYIIPAAFSLIAAIASAQDFKSAHAFADPLHLNPALMSPNQDIRANIGYRSQWADIDGMATMRANVQAPLWENKSSQLDMGLAFYNDQEGGFKTNDIKLGASYSLQLGRAHHLSAGLLTGYGSRAFDFGTQTWDSQYQSGEFRDVAPNGEIAGSEQASWVNTGFGVLYYYAPSADSVSVFAGVSGHHVFGPSETYLVNSNGKLLPRYSAVAGVNIAASSAIDIAPHSISAIQGGTFEFSLGMAARYTLPFGWSSPKKTAAPDNEIQLENTAQEAEDAPKKKTSKPFFEKQDPSLILGVYYHHHSQSASASIGLRLDKFALAYGYDFARQAMRSKAFGNSTHEITLSFLMQKGSKSFGQVLPIW
jgi:type IX secretion system PorP/SprF family membrane protein